MCSTEIAFGVSHPGDVDYPLKTSQGAAGSISQIRGRCDKKAPYEDPDFPATDASIGKAKGDTAKGDAGKSSGKYVWLRPHEICKEFEAGKPQFAVAENGGSCTAGGDGGARCSGLDIRQGGLGDCWYLAAVATLTSNPEQLNIVVPEDNYEGFEDEAYCGAFHFRFYNMASGKYADVVIDDRIPCRATDKNSAFAKFLIDGPNGRSTEFWPVLIEKAFAKYRGSYRAIEGGGTATALELFTGGFAGWWYMSDYKDPAKYDELATKVRRYLATKQYLGIGAQSRMEKAEKAGCAEGYTKLGLKCSHCYSVLGGAELKEKDDPAKVHLLLQVKNPWGHAEWTGPFSDSDDAGWAQLEKDLRARDSTGSAKVDEGVFWMDLHDVIKYFSTLDYCLFGLDGGTQFCSIRSEWPAELQEKKIQLTDQNSFQYAPAFSFEVKRELLALKIPAEHEGKCISVLRIVAGEAGRHLDPLPKFKYYIYEIRDGDDLTNLDHIYKKRSSVKYGGPNQYDSLNVLGIYLKPGRYFVTVVLRTDDANVIPKEYVGKPIPFAVSLYTENKTCLEKIN